MKLAKKGITYLLIICLALLNATSYQLFIFSNRFAPAGLNGICTMIQHIFGINVGYLSLIINFPLAIWTYFKVGRSMAIRSMLYVVAFSLSLIVLEWVDLSAFAYETANGTSKILGPLVAGLISILVNLVLCMVLTDRLQVAGLAIATSVSSTVYALLLDLPLERRGEGFLNGSFLLELGKMAAATVAMALCAWCAMGVTAGLFSGKLGLLVSMGAAAAVGVAVYFVAALILRLKEAAMVCDIAKGILKRG